MRYYNKRTPFTPEEGIGAVAMQVCEVECHRCHSLLRFPVQEDFTDWKLVAEETQRYMREQHEWLVRMMADLDVMDSENPINHYIQNEWKAALKQWEAKYG